MDRPNVFSVEAASQETEDAVRWLRGAVAAVIDVAPLSGWMKRRGRGLLRSVPDRLLASWARSLKMDYVWAYRACPDFAQLCRVEQGKAIVQHYLAAYRAVSLGNSLGKLADCVLQQQRESRLPLDKGTVERQVCALAWGDFVPGGAEFMPQARDILKQGEQAHHVLIDYHLALDSGQVRRLHSLDEALCSVPYGTWVNERLEEVKRWLGIDEPIVRVRQGQRSPLWELLWEILLAGAGNDKYNS